MFIYTFEEIPELPEENLGQTGYSLGNMSLRGLPVPPGFIILLQKEDPLLTESGNKSDQMWRAIRSRIADIIEAQTNKEFGSSENFLLLSVRPATQNLLPPSRHCVLLNIGLNDKLVKTPGNYSRFTLELYCRLLQDFGISVFGVNTQAFREIAQRYRVRYSSFAPHRVSAEQLWNIVQDFKNIISRESGRGFPQDANQQLRLAISSIYTDWRKNNTQGMLGWTSDIIKIERTAQESNCPVVVQAMVFGNLNDKSGTGIMFTRDPSTGARVPRGHIVFGAQSYSANSSSSAKSLVSIKGLKSRAPELHFRISQVSRETEQHLADMQEIEFVVEDGQVWIVNSRPGKRKAEAAAKIAAEMFREGVIDKRSAIMKVTTDQVLAISQPDFLPVEKHRARQQGTLIVRGLGAAPGVGVGKVALDTSGALALAEAGEKVVLVRSDTTPDDLQSMLKSAALVTITGGVTSHAAIIARNSGIPCVVGCNEIELDLPNQSFMVADQVVRAGDVISVDGNTGEVYIGTLSVALPALQAHGALRDLLNWSDEVSEQDSLGGHALQVWANADTPDEVEEALSAGARGIGLCRTENMLLENLSAVQMVVLADDEATQRQFLSELYFHQKKVFREILYSVDGNPINVRLIDPPLHEFFPTYEDLLIDYWKLELREKSSGDLKQKEQLLTKIQKLREQNPMLGSRGVRLSVIFPAIIANQLRALLETSSELAEEGFPINLGILIPFVSDVREIRHVKNLLSELKEEMKDRGRTPPSYRLGSMIEVPRAALTAHILAKEVDFLSFGTNDLTQMTFGISRDDGERKFLTKYLNHALLPANPFQKLDQEGVGQLMNVAVNSVRRKHPDFTFGICGEQAGANETIDFCYTLGVDYVSCSLPQILAARLAVAQASIEHNKAQY